jgi:hypothetical protein
LGSEDQIPGCHFPRFGVYIFGDSTVRLFLSESSRNCCRYCKNQISDFGILGLREAAGRRFDSRRAQKKILLFRHSAACTVRLCALASDDII